MDFSKLKIISVITLVLGLGLEAINPHSVSAGIFVADVIGLKNQRVFLSAQTRGKLFAKGGELVEFHVDGKSLDKTLSGGDGFAYKPFTPAGTGLFQIRVSSANDNDTRSVIDYKTGPDFGSGMDIDPGDAVRIFRHYYRQKGNLEFIQFMCHPQGGCRKRRTSVKHVFHRSPDEMRKISPTKPIIKSAIHFQKDDEPVQARKIEKQGQANDLNTGAFLAARWEKPLIRILAVSAWRHHSPSST